MRKTAVLDAPLLIESGLDSVCDAVACLNAPAALCRNRIMQRDGIDENEAEKRLAARRPLENGGDIMYYTNDGSITQLEQFARRVYLTATETHNRRHG